MRQWANEDIKIDTRLRKNNRKTRGGKAHFVFFKEFKPDTYIIPCNLAVMSWSIFLIVRPWRAAFVKLESEAPICFSINGKAQASRKYNRAMNSAVKSEKISNFIDVLHRSISPHVVFSKFCFLKSLQLQLAFLLDMC